MRSLAVGQRVRWTPANKCSWINIDCDYEDATVAEVLSPFAVVMTLDHDHGRGPWIGFRSELAPLPGARAL